MVIVLEDITPKIAYPCIHPINSHLDRHDYNSGIDLPKNGCYF